jgi:hypothetical protein
VELLLLQTLFLLGLFLTVTSFQVEARGLIPCGGSYGTDAEKAPCTICRVVSAGDQGMMQTAKGGIWVAFIGFAVMLSAWLIVNTVLSILTDTDHGSNKPLSGLVQNGQFSFMCDTSSNAA